MINFGVGTMIAIPTHLADGTAIARPKPVKLGVLQEGSIDLSVDIKTLHGSGTYPVAVAQGKGKVELKAKTGEISGPAMGSLYFGQASQGGIKDVVELSTSIPESGILNIAPPNAGTWKTDFGVYDASTGSQLTPVESAPKTGEYTVADGHYTFAAADEGLDVTIVYEYAATSGNGQIYHINQRLMGYTPSFAFAFRTAYDGKTLTGMFFRGVSGKLSLPLKNEDFTVSDFEAQFFANGAGNVGWLCLQG